MNIVHKSIGILVLSLLPARSSSGHHPSSHALQVNSSWTYSLSLHVVQIQQQLTSPFLMTCTHRDQTSNMRGHRHVSNQPQHIKPQTTYISYQHQGDFKDGGYVGAVSWFLSPRCTVYETRAVAFTFCSQRSC